MTAPAAVASLTRGQIRTARRGAMTVDLAAVGASMGANIAAAPASTGGWAVAIVAPAGLFAAVYLWHHSRGIVAGAAARLFSGLLGLVGVGAAAVSFEHWTTVAERYGQSPAAAIVLPLVVDLTAVLATIVAVSAGHRLAEVDAAEREAEAMAERVEAERVAAELERRRVAELAEVERAEREHLAKVEAERVAAELERARLDAETETARLAAAEVERRAAAEARLAAHTAPLRAVPNRPAPITARKAPEAVTAPSAADTGALIADYLTANPSATQSEVAAAVGVASKTVQRSAAWRDHKTARETSPPMEATS